jgi:hypothetical protein
MEQPPSLLRVAAQAHDALAFLGRDREPTLAVTRMLVPDRFPCRRLSWHLCLSVGHRRRSHATRLVAHLPHCDIYIVQCVHQPQQLRPYRLVQENGCTNPRRNDEVGRDRIGTQPHQHGVQHLRVQVRPVTALQPHDVVLFGVELCRAGVVLKRSDALRQEIKQHHHRRQALARQKLYPLDHWVVGPL